MEKSLGEQMRGCLRVARRPGEGKLQYVMLNSDKDNVFEIGIQTTIVLYAPKLLYMFLIFRP